MKLFRKHILFFSSVLFVLLAAILENQTLNNHPEVKVIQNFQKALLDQEFKLSKHLTKTELKINDSLSAENYASTFSELNHLFEDEGLGFIVYKKMKMIYWSSNQFAFENILNKVSVANKLITLPNGIFVAQTRIIGNYQIIGLIHVKNNYSYENQYLENSFAPPFSLPPGYKINISRVTNATEIHDSKNQYLFTVLPSTEEAYSEIKLYIPAVLYLLGFIMLLVLLYKKSESFSRKYYLARMILLFIALTSIYFIHIQLKLPAILSHIGLFSAKFYAVSGWLPSLGDFFFITVLFFFWSLIAARDLSPDELLRKKLIVPAFAFAALLYQLVGFMIENLISNSNISYKLNRITDIDQYSISAYLAIAMLLFSVFIIHLRIIQKTEHLYRKNFFLKLNLAGVLLSVTLCLVFPSGWSYILTLFFCCQFNSVHGQKNAHRFVFALVFHPFHLAFFDCFTDGCIQHGKKKGSGSPEAPGDHIEFRTRPGR